MTRARRLRTPVGSVVAMAGVVVLLAGRDPHVPGSYGWCPWLLLTGTYCPGCGSLRAVHELANGELGSAASSNLVLVLALPPLAAFVARWLWRAWTGRPGTGVALRPAGVAFAGLALLGFAVVRNLPVGTWLAP